MATPGDPEEQRRSSAQADGRDSWGYAQLGAQLAVTVALGLALGWWLDGRFGWAPWGVLAGGVLGAAVGLYHFLRKVL